MTTDPDTMTPEQLRDALALAAGWKCKCGPNDPHREWAEYERIDNHGPGVRTIMTLQGNPIPPLAAPEALGVIAGMMPDGWWLNFSKHESLGGWVASASRSVSHLCMPPMDPVPSFVAEGPTEAIARARLVLKVLAAAKLGDHDAPGEPHAASHSS